MQLTGTRVLSAIVPLDSRDGYPTHYDIYGNGGYMSFSNAGDMLSIPLKRQKIGMMAEFGNQLYILQNKSSSLSFDDWYKLPVSTSGLSTEDISFNYFNFSDADSALKQSLDFQDFSIKYFTISGSRNNTYYHDFEYGTNDGVAIKLNWDYTRDETGQYIKDELNNIYNLSIGQRELIIESGINDNIYTLYSSSYYNKNLSSGNNLNFYFKIFYGESQNSTLSNSNVLSLSVHEDSYLNNKNLSFLSAPTGEYIYFCYPSGYGESDFDVNSIGTDFYKYSMQVTNTFSFPREYYIYRSIYKLTSTKNITISAH